MWDNDATIEDWDRFISAYREYICKKGVRETKIYKEHAGISLEYVALMGLSAYPDKPPVFTEEQLQIVGKKFIR